MATQFFKFLPMREETLLRFSRIFLPIGSSFAHMVPSLKPDLSQIGVKTSPQEFMAMVIFSGIFSFFSFFIPVTIIGLLFRPAIEVLRVSYIGGMIFSLMIMFYVLYSIKLTVIHKTKFLEKDLLFALRYLYIRVTSGISLYDAMVGIAYGDFGEVSKEFKKTIKEISAGINEVSALENMALRNPSLYFRRIIWQITNNLRAGADIVDVLEIITSSLVKEHKILVKRYGSELNPIILMYMMFSVIIPSLGVTVIVVMSSFSGIAVPIYMFYLIPIFVFVMQFMFISLIKNKRPLMVI